MTYNLMPPLLRRWLAGVLAVLLGLGPLATPAYSALIPLADEPLAVKNSAKPNIVLTIDDSTSMLFDFLPDYVVSTYCRGATGAMTAACGSVGADSDFTLISAGKYQSPGYTYQQFNYPYSAFTGTYDASGPGAGCAAGPTCYHGIDPGLLPGIATYPASPAGPPSGWPNANLPYAYWSLWPAPPHSAALNALYYDPRLTYDPPVDSTGTSYTQMDAAGSSNWTKVPGDPWASTVTNVDLTASVTDGLWCNSDWSLGSSTDPTQCRYNGQGGAAFGTVTAPEGQDYTYPWAPPGFVVSASAGATTSNTYAAQKVTLDATLKGTAITANWTAATQQQNYFYENENILWCDPTSSSWPQTGAPLGQTCGSYTSQSCSALVQVCTKSPGACNGYSAPSCNGVVVGTCNGTLPAACNGTAAVCNNAPTCNNPGCGNLRPETCNGTAQTCPTSAQTCSGPLAQTCVLPGTQTCTTTITYNPPGCDKLPPDPENPCVPTSNPTCTPDPGHCSIQLGTSCTAANAAAVCVPQPGVCSVTGKSCMGQYPADPACVPVGHCSVDGNICSSAATDCAIKNGHCSIHNAIACSSNQNCPQSGTCSNAVGATAGHVCLVPSDCYYCSTGAMQACALGVAQCTPGTCSQRLCPDGKTPCSSNANCVGIGTGICQAAAGCTSAATCPLKNGSCANGGNACTSSAQCSATPGTCSRSNGQPWSLKPCTGNAQCLTLGTCNNGGAACNANVLGVPPNGCPEVLGTCAKDPTVKCRGANDCSSVGTCANTHAACNAQVPCANLPGNCSITNAACTTPGAAPPSDPTCPAIGKCSITGAQCDFVKQLCPAQPGPLPPSAATCTTPGVGGAATTLRQDAEGAGVACRRNNQTSAGAAYSSGAYDYPKGKFLTPITNGNPKDARYPADSCTSTDHYVATPRHYWKAEVQWCDAAISLKGDKWVGYGTNTNPVGTCQAGKDSTHIYPRFFQFGAASYVDNYINTAFQRVDLDITKRGTATYTHTWIENKQSHTITRSFDQEMTNYANWFAYYRTRIQAVKTVTSLTFTKLDNQYRVGFETLSAGLAKYKATPADPAQFVNVADFDAGQKAAWFGQLFAITIPLGLETPTLDAMARVGDYFLNGTSSELSGSTDPIILSCQKNWHMLFTDGFTNQGILPPTTFGDQDNKVPVPLPQPVPSLDTLGLAALGFNPAFPFFPPPFRENSGQQLGDAASDYAMKYWITDLRTSGPNATDNVPTTTKDPASWQHLNFAAMSLGTQGKLPVANQSLTENQLASGALQWPAVAVKSGCPPCAVPIQPDNSGVDDLWHGAINGRGRFVNAGSADELKLGMGQILEDITNQAGSRAGVGLASSSISLSNHAVYRVTFQPGWAGTVTKIDIDPVTGAEVSNIWEAAQQLHNQLAIAVSDPTCAAPGSCPWFTNRNIFTVDDTKTSVPFLWSKLSAAQQDSLAPGLPAVGQAVLEFLRGNPTNEGVSLGQFRVRATASFGENFLGDIVDSQAVFVGPPNYPYLDVNDPGYSGFVSAKAGRPARVYAGGNDGMLHAFDDASGNESWAFVPHDLYRPDNTGLGALAYQDGALPPFRHHFYVDSTPRIYDVNFGSSSADWHSLLVGGLGKGGKSYYALDVTNPGAITNEAQAAAQYLWTFTDADMGYSYGRPMLAKTRAFGGVWLMVVSAGYNNPSGVGKIFFVDAKTGTKLKEMTTPFGNSSSPSGLVHIAGYTQDFHNQLIDQIYGGDLYGNFWRFDVMDSNPANWTVSKLAYFTDPGGNPQPVTTPPEIEIDIANGVDRWVFIGTGRLLDDSDLTDPTIANQEQTFYAIRDGTTATPNPSGPVLHPRVDFVPLADKINGLAGKPAQGWFDDLPAGQRIITAVKAALSVVAYVGTAAQDNPCLTGEPAFLYVREYSLGESLLTDAGGNPIKDISEVQGAVGLDIAIFSNSSGPQSASGLDIRVAVTAGTTGDVFFQHVKPPPVLSQHRMSWRLLGQ